jgi:hypothetical protein
VHRFTRHLRGLLVALATLALSAGVVLAAHPTTADAPAAAAADGLTRAADASGKTVPVVAEEPAAPDVDEDIDEDVPEVDEDANETDDPSANAGDRPQNHGWFVSEAAKGATPETSATHGEFVSGIAQSDAGKPAAATTAQAAHAPKAPKAGH